MFVCHVDFSLILYTLLYTEAGHEYSVLLHFLDTIAVGKIKIPVKR